jgi:hypothetical protein
MRSPTTSEGLVTNILTRIGLETAILSVTANALKKGFTDATASFRQFLLRNGIHDFESQAPGLANIKYLPVTLLTTSGDILGEISLQRPATKNGRMYRLSKLGSIREPLSITPDDLLMFVASNGSLKLINLTNQLGADPNDGSMSASRGGAILELAKRHVIQVMRYMPECAPSKGGGATQREIGEISGLGIANQSISSSIIPILVEDGKIERIKTNQRYRLCH